MSFESALVGAENYKFENETCSVALNRPLLHLCLRLAPWGFWQGRKMFWVKKMISLALLHWFQSSFIDFYTHTHTDQKSFYLGVRTSSKYNGPLRSTDRSHVNDIVKMSSFLKLCESEWVRFHCSFYRLTPLKLTISSALKFHGQEEVWVRISLYLSRQCQCFLYELHKSKFVWPTKLNYEMYLVGLAVPLASTIRGWLMTSSEECF